MRHGFFVRPDGGCIGESLRREKKSRAEWRKRGLAVLTSAALLTLCIPAFPRDVRAEEDASQNAAMGRYLEEDLPLPQDCHSIEQIQILDDGTLRLAYNGKDTKLYYADSQDGGQSWGDPVSMMELVGLDPDSYYLTFPGLAPDGGIFVSARQPSEEEEQDERGIRRYYIDGDGNVRELSIEGLGEFLYSCRFTDRGTVLFNNLGNGVAEISLEDGSVLRIYEEGAGIDYFTCFGNTILLCSNGKLLCYDMESGDPVETPRPLEEDISADENNLYITSVGFYPVVFVPEDESGSIFYMDAHGLYHYSYGGSVVEQIMDGSLNSVASPSVALVDLTRDQEGRFYLAALDYERDPSARLLRYEYSADTPAVPDTELKIYSLMDSDLIHQAAALFQKKYPDIYVSVETGMSGEDAVTSADALRTLNTEIMADKGPDILLMDGIPADTYIQEGLLADISGILDEIDETEGLLPNIYEVYKEEDGSVYRMPAKFAIPMIQGAREDVEKIVDLKTLADVVEAHEGEYGVRSFPFFQSYSSRLLLKGLSGVCAPAWTKEDGTLDEEAVGEYLTLLGRIYQSTELAREEMMAKEDEYYEQSLREIEPEILDEAVSASSLSLLSKDSFFGLGTLGSNNNLSMVYSAELADSSLMSKLWDGQVKNVFYPRQIVGISARSREREAAELFVRFLFGSEGQDVGNSMGLPVNAAAYDSDSCWQEGKPGESQGSVTSIDRESGTQIDMEIYNPSGERIEEVKALGRSLTVPAASNDIILNAVTDAGSRYLEGELSLEEALNEIAREVNLYLSE